MDNTFDLSTYQNLQISVLQSRLAEISQFISSLHLAISNYEPTKIKDESLLLHLRGEYPKADELENPGNRQMYQLVNGTEDFSILMSLLAMFTITEECLRNLLIPYQAMLRCLPINGDLETQKYQNAWDEQSKKLADSVFGNLVRLTDEAITLNGGPNLPDDWKLHLNRLDSFRKVRNCLAHRLGVVSEIDLDTQGKLCVSWYGLDMLVDGECFLGAPRIVEAGGVIGARMSLKNKEWSIRERVLFTPNEVIQIAFYLIQLLNSIGSLLMQATLHLYSQKY